MIEHLWTVLCTKAIYDSETNNVSLIEVLEQINLPRDISFPVQVGIKLDLVAVWMRSPINKPTKGTARVTLLTPSKEKSKPVELPIDLSHSERHRSRFRFLGVPIKEPGYHYFLVEYREQGKSRWEQATKVPLSIRLMEKSEEGAELRR